MDYINKISTLENLMMAWRKLEKSFEYGDVWFDPVLIAVYKMNLLDNLKQLSDKLQNGSYNMRPISPVPFPKSKSAKGEFRIRQSFYIHIEDQIVWVAVCNIIGWIYDRRMPAWSYGNRLYLYMWKENDVWKQGNYRNSYKLLYRKWSHGLPVMRKHIMSSLQNMAAHKSKESQDAADITTFNEDGMQKLEYLRPDYFSQETCTSDSLYWAVLDFEKFYQNVDINKVKQILIQGLANPDEKMINLINRITTFKVNYCEYPESNTASTDELKLMQLESRPEVIGYLPTGLIVAGFLSNVFMLDIDDRVCEELKKDRTVIHFRYVDDHVFVSSNPRSLCNWIKDYKELAETNGLQINFDKFGPSQIFHSQNGNTLEFEKDDEDIIENIKKYACLDPTYPTPLVTQTWNKVSQLSKLNLNLLNHKEFDLIFNDLLTLLVTDIPEQEMKKSTRISFVCTMLSRLLVNDDIDYKELYRLRRELYDRITDTTNDINNKDAIFKELFNDCNEISINLDKLSSDDEKIIKDINEIIKLGNNKKNGRNKRIFKMLVYALKQNPDKIKAWVRTLTFCSKHYPEGVKEVYKLLAKLHSTNEISKSSAEYIYAVLNLLRADIIVCSTAKLANKDSCTEQENNELYELISNICNVSMIEGIHYFVADSKFVLNKAISFYNDYAERCHIAKINCNAHFMTDEIYHGYNLDKTFWLRWMAYIVADNTPKEHNGTEKIFSRYKEHIQLSSIFYDPLVFSGGKQLPINKTDYAGWYSLAQWIDMAKNTESNKKSLYNSELLAVNIMLAICNQLKDRENKGLSSNTCLTINNILLDKKIDNITWHSLCAGNESIENIKVKFIDNQDNLRKYYLPPLVMGDSIDRDVALSYGLGIIFLQLLTQRTSLPWIFNRPLYGFEWQPAINELMRCGQISSYNYRIVRSCLSLRNMETRFLRVYLEDEFINDTHRDAPIIGDWRDLMGKLLESNALLKENIVLTANGEPRQLTVIDLE